MRDTKVAKLFKNGASQAVRLPAEFRFHGAEVYATQNEATGDVLLSKRPGAKTWQEFFEFARSVDVPPRLHGRTPDECASSGASSS